GRQERFLDGIGAIFLAAQEAARHREHAAEVPAYQHLAGALVPGPDARQQLHFVPSGNRMFRAVSPILGRVGHGVSTCKSSAISPEQADSLTPRPRRSLSNCTPAASTKLTAARSRRREPPVSDGWRQTSLNSATQGPTSLPSSRSVGTESGLVSGVIRS